MFSKDVPQNLHRQVIGQGIQVSAVFAKASSSTLKSSIIPNVLRVKGGGRRSEGVGGLRHSLSRYWQSWGRQGFSPRASLKTAVPTTLLLVSEVHFMVLTCRMGK